MKRSIDRSAPVAERRAFGKSRRRVVPRSDQAIWRPGPARTDPVALLESSTRGRIEELLPIKWGRMAATPFAFFRGAVPVMAADLASQPTTRLHVQMCGDAHVRNLGAFAAPDGHLVFDINDFDESMPGPWEWDLKRLATSLVLAGREAGQRPRIAESAVKALVRSYRESLACFSTMPPVEVMRHEIRRYQRATPAQSVLQKAERTSPLHALLKLTVSAPRGLRRFRHRPPLLTPVSRSAARRVLASLASYRSSISHDRQFFFDAYRPVDVAFKVVGTGSVGVRDYVVLCLGEGWTDPLFLQVKEEPPSSYAPLLPKLPPPRHEGRRVAVAQHRMQTISDPFLGWTSIEGRDFLVRQLADHKASVEPPEMRGGALPAYAEVSGELLAKAHARTGDAAALSGYCGRNDRLDEVIAQFAVAYADQTEADHAVFLKAIRAGRLRARRGL